LGFLLLKELADYHICNYDSDLEESNKKTLGISR